MNTHRKYGLILLLCLGVQATCLSSDEIQSTEQQNSNSYPLDAINAYESTLPKITKPQKNDSNEMATEIANLLCKYNKIKKDTSIINKDNLINTIKYFVDKKECIHIILTSFSVKSSNTDTKTLNGKLDLAEYVGLYTLNHVCDQIKSIYAPGAKITIYSREVQCDYINKIVKEACDVELFPEQDRLGYQKQLKLLVEKCFKNLTIGEVDEKTAHENYAKVCIEYKRNSSIHKDLCHFWKCDLEQTRIKQAIKMVVCQENENKSITEPILQANKIISKQELKKLEKQKVQKINQAVNLRIKRLTEEIADCISIGSTAMKISMDKFNETKKYIRLSVHSNPDVSTQVGFALVYIADSAPWHHTIALDGSKLIAKSKQEIQKYATKINAKLVPKAYDLLGLSLEYINLEPINIKKV